MLGHLSRREVLLGALALSCARPRIRTKSRQVSAVLRGIATTDGAGVQLTRVIGQPALRHLDPFIMLDRFHSSDPNAYMRGFPDHPHRGFETVTVMLDGRMRHKDSRGNAGLIQDGGVQWMTAGRGIVHSEMPEQTGGLMSGFQLWLNLPAREKMRAQEYQDLQKPQLVHVPLIGGGMAHVISGRALDANGPVAPRTTEPLLLTAELEDERPLVLETAMTHTAFVFVHTGAARVGDKRVEAGHLAVLGEGDTLEVRADGMRTGILVAAAKPLHEPIVQRGPFVMNTEGEIQQAYADYRSGILTL
jgi:quercetin 2,3-dioxygenase